jgi:OOP family OmpA-OmpF porin
MIRIFGARAGLALLAGLLLAACQTVPVAPSRGLTAVQVETLKAQGFVQGPSGWEFGFADKLLFPTDQSRLADSQRQSIERITRALLSVAIDRARVEGHTDNTGTRAYNQALSLERARAVANAMERAGMPAAGLAVEGVADRYPVAPNTTPSGRQENRRVVIIISSE